MIMANIVYKSLLLMPPEGLAARLDGFLSASGSSGSLPFLESGSTPLDFRSGYSTFSLLSSKPSLTTETSAKLAELSGSSRS